jgi:hypothetical protein
MKLLYVAGTSLAIGLTWFLVIFALLTQGLGIEPPALVSMGLFLACAAAGAVAGWRLFVVPSQRAEVVSVEPNATSGRPT